MNNPNTSVIILCAGKGRRMGAEVNKVYLPLLNIPILAYSINEFYNCPDVSEIILVGALGELGEASEIGKKYGKEKFKKVVPGGKERPDSVRAGLSEVSKDAKYIAIHDGARPLITQLDIENVLNAVKTEDISGAILASPVTDTIKKAKRGIVEGTLDRSKLWRAETPQIFKADILKKAYTKNFDGCTDDEMVVSKIGGKVKVVEGRGENLKMTTPFDLAVAQVILERRGQ